MPQHPRKKPEENAFLKGILDPVCLDKHWICIPQNKIQPGQSGSTIRRDIQLNSSTCFDTTYAIGRTDDTVGDNTSLFEQTQAFIIIEEPQQKRKLIFENSSVRSRTVTLRPKTAQGLTEKQYSNTLEIFLAYSEKDEELIKRFSVYLEVLQRQFQTVYRQRMTFWSINNIIAGQNWKQTIEQHLTTARIILLMVSIDFLNSDFCRRVEMTAAMTRHFNNDARVIPVILRTCSWEKEAFGQLQPLPANRKPVNKWHDRDEAFAKISEGIWTAIEELLTQGLQAL